MRNGVVVMTMALAMCAGLGLSACASGSSGSTESSGSVGGSTPDGSSSATQGNSGGASGAKLLGFASPTEEQPSVSLIGTGMEQAADTLGWKVSVFDSALDPGKQVSNITTLLQKGASAIASWTLDAGATAGVYDKAVKKGVPIVGVNSEGQGVSVSVYSQIQQCSPGGTADQTAERIAKAFPGGSVITLGLDSVPSWKAVDDCFEAAAKAHGLTVLAHQSNESDNSSGANKIAQPLLTKYPNVNAIWCYDDATALGASAAVLASGKQISDGSSNGVMVFGENGDADAIAAVRAGRLTGTWDINSVEMGWEIVKVMEDKLSDQTIPTTVVVKSTLWDKANVGKYVDPKDRKVSFDSVPLVSGS